MCCDGEKSLQKALSQTKPKKIKAPKKNRIISFIFKLITTSPELKLTNERR